jgi:hypothetical protein
LQQSGDSLCCLDIEFERDFFLTYLKFTTSVVVLNHLIKRYFITFSSFLRYCQVSSWNTTKKTSSMKNNGQLRWKNRCNKEY